MKKKQEKFNNLTMPQLRKLARYVNIFFEPENMVVNEISVEIAKRLNNDHFKLRLIK